MIPRLPTRPIDDPYEPLNNWCCSNEENVYVVGPEGEFVDRIDDPEQARAMIAKRYQAKAKDV